MSRHLRSYTSSFKYTVVLAFCFGTLAGGTAKATEGGGTQWALGVQTIAPAVLPPAGATEFYDYFEYYHATSFKDANGKGSVSGFKLNAEAEAGRIVQTWLPTFYGLNISSGVILTVDNLDLGVNTPAGHAHQSQFGLDYLIITPIYLTYNTDKLHILFGPEAFVPTAIPVIS